MTRPTPPPAADGPADPGVGERTADDGVLSRVRRRTARAGGVPPVVGLALVLCGWWWPGWFVGPAGTAIGLVAVALCALATAALIRRVRLWSAASRVAESWPAAAGALPGTGFDARSSAGLGPVAGWANAVCGAPQPLHRPDGPAMLRRARRYPAHIVAVRATTGPLADGHALTVHGRADGLAPTSGDRLVAHAITSRGPFLLGRPADGALFVADRWSFVTL